MSNYLFGLVRRISSLPRVQINLSIFLILLFFIIQTCGILYLTPPSILRRRSLLICLCDLLILLLLFLKSFISYKCKFVKIWIKVAAGIPNGLLWHFPGLFSYRESERYNCNYSRNNTKCGWALNPAIPGKDNGMKILTKYTPTLWRKHKKYKWQHVSLYGKLLKWQEYTILLQETITTLVYLSTNFVKYQQNLQSYLFT